MSDQPEGGKKTGLVTQRNIARRVLRYLQFDWLRVGMIGLLALLIHLPALSGEMIWDDTYLAGGNPFIKSPLLILEAFRHYLFLDSFSGHYRPVQNISFTFDYLFWNDNFYGFHLTNILLHAASGVLLYFLLRRILRPFLLPQFSEAVIFGAAFFIALLWTVHPVHSAAVDYISGRADSLAFLFAAAGWLLFLRGRDQNSPKARILLYAFAVSSALLALCSRETAAIWLLIFVVHTLFFCKRSSRLGKVFVLSTCIALCFAYLGLRHLPEHRSEATSDPGWCAPMRAVLIFRALGDYGRLMVFPVHLHMERTVVDPSNYRSYASWQNSIASEYLSLLGLGVGAILIAGSAYRGHGRKTRIFGTCWFLLGFLPVSNLINLNATVAEHWLYLPSVGLLLFLCGVALDLPPRLRPLLSTVALLAVLALSIRSFQRSGDWTTAEHFYQRTIAAGGSSARVSLNLGQLYASRGEYARAEKIFREILRSIPDHPIAKSNLANALFRQGKKEEAEALFASATAAAARDRYEYPRTWLAAVNLAAVRRERNDTEGAFAILDKARLDFPDVWEIISRESELLRETKGPKAAFKLVADFSRDHWWHYGATLALGRLYAEAGDAERAVQTLRSASWLDVHEVEALNLIARVRVRQHRFADAYRAQKRAVARQPDAPSQYILLSDILEKMGQTAAARDAITKVSRLQAIGRSSPALAN